MENRGSQEDQAPYIKGEVTHVIFHNEENFYTVAAVKVLDTTEQLDEPQVTVVGTLPKVEPEDVYVFFGRLHDHPKFGLQYVVEQFRRDIPQTAQGIIHYLSSDRFPGIGKKTAESIVKSLGERVITLILEDPSVLENVPKLTEDKRKLIYDQLVEHQGIEQVILFLSKYGFGIELAVKIYQVYKQQTLDVIQTNPYQLIQDVEGIGFKRADLLGEAIGISGNHPDRIQAGCIFCLNELSNQQGHVFLAQTEIVHEVIQLLSTSSNPISAEEVESALTIMDEEGKIVIEEERIYLKTLFFAEKGLVTNIKRLVNREEPLTFVQSEFLTALGELEETLKMEYAESQKKGIETALSSPIMILTGGPGTGKTTVIKGIVEIYAKLHGVSLEPSDYKDGNPFPVLLVAPTGRAAKRMGEATNLPSLTIHRLLGWKGGTGGFEKNEHEQLEGNLLIVDEVSMVDIWLANQLFKSIPDHMQVILVGDQDQLPSVGPGQVLSDLLRSRAIPIVELTDIYRQEEGSSIIKLAHEIKNGALPEDLKEAKDDRRFFPCHQNQVMQVIEKVYLNAVKKGYAPKDIQVLAPMYRGNAGIERLNLHLQNLVNPPVEGRREIEFGDVVYRKGDVVLQLMNNPDEQVFNGDRGEIVAIIYAKENVEKVDQIVISFEGIEVVYTKKDLSQITHAYCSSIHKAQGSEFPIVIMPVVKGYFRMLRRNLIYTGVTRAKQFLILCGEQDALFQAIEQKDEHNRNSMLCDKLKDSLVTGN
ncbi:SF1B family DNA helicase RecD2 [Alkalihalobacterium chitinilyticum]|uniref:ATP-dependent RecD2 DNA helicase n=1 Tax=Alkalihalobacterium chitinilyticum TaxID=2980103 RepID=A0ABT5VEH5_9BACI|nr:ATP-dependent RecD-like DNA helicase [Alkalihalobacterium chitinilyticum]MDE5413732.1 ATP-dependent RecD-like DNA helicase [Alkalihalobacterium chitinilyticum]